MGRGRLLQPLLRALTGSRGHTLFVVRLASLFMSCCCYPKIACGFTRPRPPSRETRMNGRQLQPSTGNRYSTASFPHSPAKPPQHRPQTPACALVPGPAASREHQLQLIVAQEWGCQRKGGEVMETTERGRAGTGSSKIPATQVTVDQQGPLAYRELRESPRDAHVLRSWWLTSRQLGAEQRGPGQPSS